MNNPSTNCDFTSGACPYCGFIAACGTQKNCRLSAAIPRGPDSPALSEGDLFRFGDQAAKALSLVGITKERVSAWIGEPCNCLERQEKWNKFGAWCKSWLSGDATEAEKAKSEAEAALAHPDNSQ